MAGEPQFADHCHNQIMGDLGVTGVIIFLLGKTEGESNILTVGQVCMPDGRCRGEGLTRKVR